MRKAMAGLVLAAGLFAATAPAMAITATIEGEPNVSVTVPAGFVASDTDRGVEIKTPDEEVMAWFETYEPDDEDELIKEHNKYWASQNVVLGEGDQATQKTGDMRVAATAFNKAKWKGKPTVVHYLFIDAGFPSKQRILMSVWASPEGYAKQNNAIWKMIESLDAK